jgi:hypothetical protein
VGADAAFCPNCGEDLRPRRGHGTGAVVAAVVIALLVGGGIAYAITKIAGTNETTTVEKSAGASSSIGVSVTAPTRTVTGPTSTVTGPTSTVTGPDRTVTVTSTETQSSSPAKSTSSPGG